MNNFFNGTTMPIHQQAAQTANPPIKNRGLLAENFFTHTIKSEWFAQTKNPYIWQYIIENNDKTTGINLFPINIGRLTIVSPDNNLGFKYLIVCYDFAPKSNIYVTVIPYEKYVKKQLREFFRIPAGFNVIAKEKGVIDEFLYFLIQECKAYNYIDYPSKQGWVKTESISQKYGQVLNFDADMLPEEIVEKLERNESSYCGCYFDNSARYPNEFYNFLPDCIKKRSIPKHSISVDDILEDLFEILPCTEEIRFIIALRISSLLLYFFRNKNIKPQQIFIFETADQLTLEIIADLLQTNDPSCSKILSLSDSESVLKSELDQVCDGIVPILDNSIDYDKTKADKAINILVNDLFSNNMNPNAPRHIISIISRFSNYDIPAENVVYQSVNNIVPQNEKKFSRTKLREFLSQLDYSIIEYVSSSLALREKGFEDYIKEVRSDLPVFMPEEMTDTYTIIRAAMNFTNNIAPYAQRFPSSDFSFAANKLITIDRAGQSNTNRVISDFSSALSRKINENTFRFAYLSTQTVENDSPDIIFIDDRSIYLDTDAIDRWLIPCMNIKIKHRQLIQILNSCKYLDCTNHFCHRLNMYDTSGNLQTIYRYAIKIDILNLQHLKKLKNIADDEYFLQPEEIPRSDFLPLAIDPNTGKYIGRIFESGVKANNHILITGESGSGKSYLMAKTVAYLNEMGYHTIMFDSSGSAILDELLTPLPKSVVEDNFDFIDLESEPLDIDPFDVKDIKRSDSRANIFTSILLSAAIEITQSQTDRLQTLIHENIHELCKNDSLNIETLKNLLIEDGSTLSSLKTKLIPTLNFFESKKTDNRKTWNQLIEESKKTIVISLDARSGACNKKIFDILIASLYNYHSRHRADKLFIIIDEITDQNLSESGIINKIFTQGRKHNLNIIAATQKFRLSGKDEWDTLNNAKTKIFFKPHPNFIYTVMNELNMPQSERRILADMKKGDCFISAELYSKKALSNQPAIVRGHVPEKYIPLKDILPPLPNYKEETAADEDIDWLKF